MNGGPVETARWEANVSAILEAWYAGQEQGNPGTHILFGDVNPSGKLTLTFPRNQGESPITTSAQYPGVDGIVQYSEALFAGYRGYDQFDIEPQYPFGHGLSYTSFAYDQLSISPETPDSAQAIRINFTITNTGVCSGTEIAQIYLGMPSEVAAPPKKLVDWVRVTLQSGQTQAITISLDPQGWERPLSHWNSQRGRWEIARGSYQVFIGASSRDVRLSGTFRYASEN